VNLCCNFGVVSGEGFLLFVRVWKVEDGGSGGREEDDSEG
jgi:hypothetical protein